jgi:hypothetical protein
MPEPGADPTFVNHDAGFFSQGRYTISLVQSLGEGRACAARGPGGSGRRNPTGLMLRHLPS